MPQFGRDLRSIKDGEEIRKTNWGKERAEESQSSRNDKTVTIVVVVPCLMGGLLLLLIKFMIGSLRTSYLTTKL